MENNINSQTISQVSSPYSCLDLKEVQNQMDSWILPLENEMTTYTSFNYYEVPMIGPTLFGFFIENGMKSGIPSDKHKHIGCYFGEIKFLNEFFQFFK